MPSSSVASWSTTPRAAPVRRRRRSPCLPAWIRPTSVPSSRRWSSACTRSRAPSRRPSRDGDRLGRYVIEGELGHGGMGLVYRARDPELDRAVAIKVLPPRWAGDRDQQGKLRDESRALAQLQHPNVVAIHEAGLDDGERLPGHGPGRGADSRRRPRRSAARSSESLDGALLRSLVPAEADGRAGLIESSYDRSVAAIFIRDGLGCRGGARARHPAPRPQAEERDPGRRGASGGARLRARLAGPPPSPTAEIHSAERRPTSLPNSCAMGRSRDDLRTDVYQLGLVLYELLTRKRAYHAADRDELIQKILAGSYAEPRALRPGVPRDLEAICLKAMAHDCVRPLPLRHFVARGRRTIPSWRGDPRAPGRRRPAHRSVGASASGGQRGAGRPGAGWGGGDVLDRSSSGPGALPVGDPRAGRGRRWTPRSAGSRWGSATSWPSASSRPATNGSTPWRCQETLVVPPPSGPCRCPAATRCCRRSGTSACRCSPRTRPPSSSLSPRVRGGRGRARGRGVGAAL